MCFDSFGIEYIPQKALSEIKDNFVTHNIIQIQSDDFIMCVFYRIALIGWILAGKALLDYTNIFFPNDYEKNDKIMHKYFKDKYGNL